MTFFFFWRCYCSDKFFGQKFGAPQIGLSSYAHDYLRSLARSLLILLPVSTFPWLIYMLAFIISEGFVLEIHAYTSWLQGVGVFIIFCVLNRVDREKIARGWQRSSIGNRFQNIPNCSQERVGSQAQQIATGNS